MIELAPVFTVAAIRGGYVVKLWSYPDGQEDGEVSHHAVTDIATVTTMLIHALEGIDAQPSRDHRTIEKRMNGR